jgi:hypothetical protein
MHTLMTPDLARAQVAELDRLSSRPRPERAPRKPRSRLLPSLRLHIRRPAPVGS